MTLFSLSDSYAYCQQLAKQTAGNFYYSFLGLRREQFQAMCVLYAYMRTVDDLGDHPQRLPAEREESLKRWRVELQQVLENKKVPAEQSYDPCFPALLDVIQRYQIPQKYFFEVISGVESDLHPVAFQTFDELADYCYRVAGVVGLCCIHIWGFHDDRAFDAGIECGLAFQMTNILRDLTEDVEMGRVYLPQEDLDRFSYPRPDIQAQVYDDRFRSLMQFEVQRTREFYQNSECLFDYISPAGQGILRAMYRIYGGILSEIERMDYDVYSSRVGLPRWRKLLIAGEAIVSSRWFFSRSAK
ncbi:MAG: phytoene/squalene synthase family protein [Planctomycetota bacterium]|jgi:15-cis-phytoene synthase|uniref:phytoene/squalene synthase family protein n=1 Tax=uncultured Gimesia sp. TaxID=1678688 RepID=UPI00262AF0B9|nr:phytoene/squalene synthase family protein [uncultured Gimesia sp.]